MTDRPALAVWVADDDALRAAKRLGADRILLMPDNFEWSVTDKSAIGVPLSFVTSGEDPDAWARHAESIARLGEGCDLRVPGDAVDRLGWSDPQTPWIVIVSDLANASPERLAHIKAAGARGVMLMPPAGGKLRLIDAFGHAAIAQVAVDCRAAGLTLSLSGGLEPPDLPRLAPLQPDELCFASSGLQAEISALPIALMRDLIAAPATPVATAQDQVPDTIFMRDWVLPVRIGAYAHEHNEPQRVRFSVEADVSPRAGRAADLRDVVSYDLITDTIRQATFAHVDLVETLAETIAEVILRHPRIQRVTVTLEKLDLGPGSMGCRIVRSKVQSL